MMGYADVKIFDFTVYPGKIEGEKALVPNILESQDRFVNTLGLTEYELYTLIREDGGGCRFRSFQPAEQAKWFPKRCRKPKDSRPIDTLTIALLRARRCRAAAARRESHAPLADPGGDRVRVARAGMPSRGRDDSLTSERSTRPIPSRCPGGLNDRRRRRLRGRCSRPVTPGATGPSSRAAPMSRSTACASSTTTAAGSSVKMASSSPPRTAARRGANRNRTRPSRRVTAPSSAPICSTSTPSTPRTPGRSAIARSWSRPPTVASLALAEGPWRATSVGRARRRRSHLLRRQVRRQQDRLDRRRVRQDPPNAGRRRDLEGADQVAARGHRVLRSPRPADAVRARCP